MKLMIVLGTRPEAIKLAPIIKAAQNAQDRFDLTICCTGQHTTMTEQLLNLFDITPDLDLAVMRENQDLPGLAGRLMSGLGTAIPARDPDVIVVQGDTTTAFCAALAGFYTHTPVAHVEAGLRTGNPQSPFPEEMNRVMISKMASLHFAPTRNAHDILCTEGIAPDTIYEVGNTVVDAVELIRSKWAAGDGGAVNAARNIVLITAHRRENFGDGIKNICLALETLCKRHRALSFVFPVHSNPNVKNVVNEALGGIENLSLTGPVNFEELLRLQSRARLIITDSGGIQEEAPCFGVPTVVLRDHTERTEGIDAGFATLAGTRKEAIISAAERYLEDPDYTEKLQYQPNPYGDGQASGRILDIIYAAHSRGWKHAESQAAYDSV